MHGVKTKFMPGSTYDVGKSNDVLKDFANSVVCAKALDLIDYQSILHGKGSERADEFVNSMA